MGFYCYSSYPNYKIKPILRELNSNMELYSKDRIFNLLLSFSFIFIILLGFGYQYINSKNNLLLITIETIRDW